MDRFNLMWGFLASRSAKSLPRCLSLIINFRRLPHTLCVFGEFRKRTHPRQSLSSEGGSEIDWIESKSDKKKSENTGLFASGSYKKSINNTGCITSFFCINSRRKPCIFSSCNVVLSFVFLNHKIVTQVKL